MPLHLPSLPITDPVAFFALVTALFLVVPVLFERARIPGLVGLILAGAVIGPNGAGVLERGEAMKLLGSVGLLYLMALVGLELDLEQFRRHRLHSVVFGVSSFLVPLVSGIVVAVMLGYAVPAATLLGAMFASHTLVGYPIASRLGILKTRAVTTVLGATLLTDLLALLVLALVAGVHSGGDDIKFWLRLSVLLPGYVALVLLGVPRLSGWFFRRFGTDSALDFPFIVAVLFASCWLSDALGIEPIIGALLTGFALNPFIPEQSALMSRIRFAATGVFVPFFLVSVGMLVDYRAFGQREAWSAIAALTVSVVASKALAAKLVGRVFGFRPEEGWVMFGLSVSHAAATMAIVLVGYDLGLFDQSIVNAVVVIILVTCVVGPAAVSRWGRVIALEDKHRAPAGPAPVRVLVPISNPATCDTLIDLAILLRPPDSSQPLLPLIVVRGDDTNTDSRVAAAERVLEHAVLRASAAQVPVAPMTRVDHNIADGIARGVTERRASMVVLGWDIRAGAPAPGFGMVVEQLLAKTHAAVMVARTAGSLNPTRRVILVLPPFANHHPGFAAALRVVKLLARQLAATLAVRVIADSTAPFEAVISATKPDVETHYLPPASWRDLVPGLAQSAGHRDVVVLLGAREGTLTWHPRVGRLPRELARAMKEAPLLVIYPGEAAEDDRSTALEPSALDEYLVPARVSSRLPRDPEAALTELIGRELDEAPEVRERAMAALFREIREDSHELRPGIALPHARVDGISSSLLFLGYSPEGVHLPGAHGPVHVLFVLLSPEGAPDLHLRALSAIARACIDDARLDGVLRRHGIERPATSSSEEA
ncbi:MAG: cation:proton antiporter [Sorangiineae bacterium]|nr:cation:proton antiporter [Polyangiaceae bacterium]MEB2324258.1 cation:proton antiporter [Sorangiineae bacterium]